MIPYGKQDITQQDINSVIEILTSDFLTQGPAIPRFENKVATLCHASEVVAVNSATSALHLACLSLGLTSGDVLWTSTITFVASANCALYCGAEVDFIDIDADTYNLCPIKLKRKLELTKSSGKKLPKIIIPVHLCGQPCDMEKIHALSVEYGFHIIEDASHAIGGRYKGEPIGNCRFSDITIFSFHPVKIITTGEGGVAVTNNKQLADNMRLLRSHGVTRDPDLMTHASHGPWYYQQVALGFNYRMTDLQAALGCSQISRLENYILKRHGLAKQYNEWLGDLPVVIPFQHEDSYSAYHLYIIRLKLNEITLTHREVFSSLREKGIGVNLHYIPVHTQPYYKKMGFAKGDCPEAEKYYQEAISLPLYPRLSSQQQADVVIALRKSLSAEVNQGCKLPVRQKKVEKTVV